MVSVPPSSSPLRVPELVARFDSIVASQSPPSRSPSSSPVLNRVASPLGKLAAEPVSPTPSSQSLPVVDQLRASAAKSDAGSASSSRPASLSGSVVLDDIKEGEALVTEPKEDSEDEDLNDAAMSESQLFPAKDASTDEAATTPTTSASVDKADASTTSKASESPAAEVQAKKDVKEDGTPSAADAASAPAKETTPLAKILENIGNLPPKDQESVRKTLARVETYPSELPLSASWTLHFSDTSGASKSSHSTTKDQYDEGVKAVFTATSVPVLCGALKAFKKAARPKRAKTEDSLGLTRAGQNLHFFRTGVSPTWEDPHNAKGGRLTISPPPAVFEQCFERLVLLIAGSVLELGAASLVDGGAEGRIIGAVASRRARGDRIELWLGGPKPREAAPSEWIDKLKETLSEELEMPELRSGKYKKHFS